MKERLTHLIVSRYPRRWSDRYGEEFEQLLVDEGNSMRTLLNVGWATLKEHLVTTQALSGGECSLSFGAIAKKPSALVPMAMSLAALGWCWCISHSRGLPGKLMKVRLCTCGNC